MAAHRWRGKYFYQILGVEPSASLEEIKSEYRWLARRFHPDQNDGDERAAKRFRDITEAYEVLSKSETRAQYDDFLLQGQSKSSTEDSPPPPPRREQTTPQQKPPYRSQGASAPRSQEKPPPRATNQTSTDENSKYKGQPAPKNQFDANGSNIPGCFPVMMLITGILLAGTIIGVAISTAPSSTVGQTSEVSQSSQVSNASDSPERFCDLVFSDDRMFYSIQDVNRFRAKLASGLDRLGYSDANVRNRGYGLLSQTIKYADSISYGSQNNIEANWQRWLQAESLLAASCGFELQ